MTIQIPNLEALPQAAEQFLAYLESTYRGISSSPIGEGCQGGSAGPDGKRQEKNGGKEFCLAFLAPMGTGKTTFISALCKALQVQDTVTSPTFAIVNEYYSQRWQEPVYHFDCYRLRTLDEARALGMDDYLHSGHLCLMEWPENVEPLLPDNTLVVRLTENPGGSRTLECGKE